MKAKSWSQRQLKKARWKKSLQRAKKRGPVYRGFNDYYIGYLRYFYIANGERREGDG